MNPEHTFTIKKNTIMLSNIDSLVEFSRYRFSDLKFLDGLLLAEDLITKAGVILCTKGKDITPERVARLKKLQSTQKNFDFAIELKRDNNLVNTFREELKKRIENQLNTWLDAKAFRGFFLNTKMRKKNIEQFISDDDIVLEVYKMLFMCDSAKIRRVKLFFDQAINTALFSAAIALSP